MKNLLAVSIIAVLATTAHADDLEAPGSQPATQPQPQLQPQLQPQVAAQSQVAKTEPATQLTASKASSDDDDEDAEDSGWHRPNKHRFLQGFRVGYTYLANWDKPSPSHDMMTLKDKFGLKTPHMMLLGYEGFYRIVGHSWLNVLLVGNVTIAGLEQSKVISAASGLIGFEFQKSFQAGIGVNLTPDPQSPSHMIVAAGWTPRVGGIYAPVHFFFVPDTDGNHRSGVTVGMTW